VPTASARGPARARPKKIKPRLQKKKSRGLKKLVPERQKERFADRWDTQITVRDRGAIDPPGFSRRAVIGASHRGRQAPGTCVKVESSIRFGGENRAGTR
jgi:hypothetical protein